MSILDNLEAFLEHEDQEVRSGYGYDELKDFDMGLKDNRKSKITPFMGPNR